MNINETRSINAFALKELANMMQLSDEELDNHIMRVRDEMMKNEDMRISEAIPKMIENRDMDDIMTGAILGIFTSDYYMDQYMRSDINAD